MRERGPLRPYLELIRPPALPSAPADSIAGLALATALGSAGDTLPALWQVAAVISLSCLCYSAGMISNDLFDVGVDREERPNRPLPSGRAKVSIAWGLCIGAQLTAILIAFQVAGAG
ncbi:MAG: UbiA family prenyltransferase, partial [Myxococcota bacterium]|nr:UbiA family prenyltransferase [Myxococcota bacterium]